MQTHLSSDAERCASALQDLIELRSKHGSEDAVGLYIQIPQFTSINEQLYRALPLLLPSSPLISLLQTLPTPQGAYTPMPAPKYPSESLDKVPTLPSPLPHVLHLLGSLPLLLHLLIRSQVLVHQETEAKVKAGRQRLGGGPEGEVRRRTDGEVLGGELGMTMVEILREVNGHHGVDDAIRSDVEVQEFNFWRRLVRSLK